MEDWLLQHCIITSNIPNSPKEVVQPSLDSGFSAYAARPSQCAPSSGTNDIRLRPSLLNEDNSLQRRGQSVVMESFDNAVISASRSGIVLTTARSLGGRYSPRDILSCSASAFAYIKTASANTVSRE